MRLSSTRCATTKRDKQLIKRHSSMSSNQNSAAFFNYFSQQIIQVLAFVSCISIQFMSSPLMLNS